MDQVMYGSGNVLQSRPKINPKNKYIEQESKNDTINNDMIRNEILNKKSEPDYVDLDFEKFIETFDSEQKRGVLNLGSVFTKKEQEDFIKTILFLHTVYNKINSKYPNNPLLNHIKIAISIVFKIEVETNLNFYFVSYNAKNNIF